MTPAGRRPSGGWRGRAARFADFLRGDERGSASLWNLFWFCGFGLLLGLGLDTTAAMNTKAKLQSVADAAAHAAVMDVFPVSGEAVDAALSYAGVNIPAIDDVVAETDVMLGYWNSEIATFQTGEVPYLNAVRVVAGRDSARNNALGTSFLRLMGMENWDIRAASVASYYGDMSLVDRCRKNGLFAGGTVRLTANNEITGEYCVHGETAFVITENNTVTCGVELSTSDPSGWQSQSVPTPSGNPGTCDENYASLSTDQMVEQTFVYRSIRSHAELEYERVRRAVDAFVDGRYDNDPFNAIPPYLTHAQSVSATAFDVLASFGLLSPGTLYVVSCGAGGVLQPRGIVRNIGIYTDCVIDVRKDPTTSHGKPKTKGKKATTCDPDIETCSTTEWQAEIISPGMDCADAIAAGYEAYATELDTADGRTYRDGVTVDTVAQDCGIEPGANGLWDNVFVFSTAFENGDHSHQSITFPNNMQIGRLDACTEGGGVRIYAAASLSTPSGTMINGSHFILLGNASFAAKLDGTYGLTIEAAGDIELASQGKLGGCAPDEADLASDVVLTVRPIAIVN